jgi:phosphoglycolate phosphatase
MKTPSERIEAVIFDLDGTLTDSMPGITASIRHAMLHIGHALSPDLDLRFCVGPPLPRCFESLLGVADPGTIDLAIRAYQERFERVGMFENAVYPGINALLTSLHNSNHGLYVVTAKPHGYAIAILQHFELFQYFQGVYGAPHEDREFTKSRLLQEALAHQALDPRRAVMIGDRADDILAAHRCGMRAIAALWGYGTRAELTQSSPEASAESPNQVSAAITAMWTV